MRRLFILLPLLAFFAFSSLQASWLSELIDLLNDDSGGAPNTENIPDEQRILSVVPRIGVVGDSITDEYSTYPYGLTAINWVQFLEKSDHGEFGEFSELRNYPRLYGYEYNWARAGSTSADLVAEGQHTGLANQIRNDWVEVAVVMIGVNDFREVYGSIYEEEWTAEQKDDFLEGLQERLDLIMSTLLAAEPKVLVVATIPDLGDAVSYRFDRFPDDEKRERVTQLIHQANTWIRTRAEEHGAIVLDLYHYFKDMVKKPVYRYYGFRVDTTDGGLEPDNFFAVDSFHPGSIAQSRIANRLLILVEDERTRLRNAQYLAANPEEENGPYEPEYRLLTPARIFGLSGVGPSAEIFFPESKYTDPSRNVILSPWFGVLAVDRFPWVNHAEHGWMYCEGYGGQQVRLWDSRLGWLYTSPEDYPLFLRAEDQHLLRYEIGSTQPRRFYDETAQQWIEVPYGALTEDTGL